MANAPQHILELARLVRGRLKIVQADDVVIQHEAPLEEGRRCVRRRLLGVAPQLRHEGLDPEARVPDFCNLLYLWQILFSIRQLDEDQLGVALAVLARLLWLDEDAENVSRRGR